MVCSNPIFGKRPWTKIYFWFNKSYEGLYLKIIRPIELKLWPFKDALFNATCMSIENGWLTIVPYNTTFFSSSYPPPQTHHDNNRIGLVECTRRVTKLVCICSRNGCSLGPLPNRDRLPNRVNAAAHTAGVGCVGGEVEQYTCNYSPKCCNREQKYSLEKIRKVSIYVQF